MPPEIVLVTITAIAAFCSLGFGLMRVVSTHLERKVMAKSGGTEMEHLRAEIDDIRTQMDGIEDVRGRFAELEERVDFAERLLAQQGDRGRIAPGPEV